MLKPCPLCGGKVRMYTTESVQSYRRAVIKCDACHLEMREEGGGYHDFATSSVDEKRKLSNERAKALATEKWNTRVCEILEGDGTGEALPEIRTCTIEHVKAGPLFAIRVVRCKECKNYRASDASCHAYRWGSWDAAIEVEPEGFCAWGERRSE